MHPTKELTRPVAGLRHSYDRGAARYDVRRYHSAEGRLFSALEVSLLRDWLPLAPGVRVLDVPAGTGRLSHALGATGATVIGADISGNMLREAAAKRSEEGPGVHFAQASGTHLPFEDGTFDAVVSFKFFHLIPNDQKPVFVRELVRVLKAGGPLVIEFNSPFYGGFLAAFRYYFRKKQPGGMRTKCLFPDQVSGLFSGLEVTRKQGVKLPFSGALARLVGGRVTASLNRWFGRLPALRYLTYAIIIEARKPAAP
jgi:demethylmenaquinone methyltransferase / 2-methoxy-6-polyprenyl-1,4-benzoquinol methylase